MKRMLRDDGSGHFMNLSDDAKLMYIIGILICNDLGVIAEDKLNAAVANFSVRYAAFVVGTRAGVFPGMTLSDRYA